MPDHKTLAAALAAFQAELPIVSKNKTNPAFKSKYADLAEVSKAAFPRLAQFGLSFTAAPTLNADGDMVLAYKLRHAPSEEVETGEYRLPQGKPQEVGSAITYGRRQCLCAVTGIVADDDDDGAAAQSTSAPQRRQQKPKGPTADELRETIVNVAKAKNLDHAALAAEYEARIKTPLAEETDPGRLQQFIDAVNADRVTVQAAS